MSHYDNEPLDLIDLSDLDDEACEQQRKADYRFRNYVRNENSKRDKIAKVAEMFPSNGETGKVLHILNVFMPNVTVATIVAAFNGERIPTQNTKH